MEVKPAEFARMAGVSRPSISEKIKNKTLIVNAAGMLDTENPVNSAYIAKHRQKRAEAEAVDYIKSGGVSGPISPEVSPAKLSQAVPVPAMDDFKLSQLAGVPRELLNMSLRELVIKFPGISNIERYAKILAQITAAAEKDQRMQERNLSLIPKDFVVSRIFIFLETLAKQALEYPDSAADKIIALSRSGGENIRTEIIETMREGIGRVLSGSKDQIVSELKTLKSKYQGNTQTDRVEEKKDVIEDAGTDRQNAAQ
jgi:hypothetical protein